MLLTNGDFHSPPVEQQSSLSVGSPSLSNKKKLEKLMRAGEWKKAQETYLSARYLYQYDIESEPYASLVFSAPLSELLWWVGEDDYKPIKWSWKWIDRVIYDDASMGDNIFVEFRVVREVLVQLLSDERPIQPYLKVLRPLGASLFDPFQDTAFVVRIDRLDEFVKFMFSQDQIHPNQLRAYRHNVWRRYESVQLKYKHLVSRPPMGNSHETLDRLHVDKKTLEHLISWLDFYPKLLVLAQRAMVKNRWGITSDFVRMIAQRFIFK